MAMFWIRTEIHKGGQKVPPSEYADLHKAMANIGFKPDATIDSIYAGLPPGEYIGEGKPNEGPEMLKLTVKIAVRSVLKAGQTYTLLIGQLDALQGFNLPAAH